MADTEEKYIGCLLGGAIGDALGMPVAGLSREQIAESGRVREFLPSRQVNTFLVPVAELGEAEMGSPLAAGQWTRHTQLTLALAETLLEEGGLLIPEAWAHKLTRWLNEEPRSADFATLYAAMQLRNEGVAWDEAADPDGVDGGPAARVAPIALLYANAPERRTQAVLLQTLLTHEPPDARAAAFAVAEAIALVLPVDESTLPTWDGISFLAALSDRVESESAAFAEFARCLTLAKTLLADDVETETAIRVLGVTDWAREAVPCALYCVARTPASLETTLLNAVNLTGGATDSIGAIAGTVGGALHGVDALPAHWRAGVEEGERIAETARALFRLSQSLQNEEDASL